MSLSKSIKSLYQAQNKRYLKLLNLLLKLSSQRLLILNLAEQLADLKVFPD